MNSIISMKSENKMSPPENQNQNENQQEISNYISSLTVQEKQTLEIAKSHLGTSFNIRKSIGFLSWKVKQ
jgi:hypothetical protein